MAALPARTLPAARGGRALRRQRAELHFARAACAGRRELVERRARCGCIGKSGGELSNTLFGTHSSSDSEGKCFSHFFTSVRG